MIVTQTTTPGEPPAKTPRQALLHRFEFHPADTAAKQEAHAVVRNKVGNLALHFFKTLPEGREQALAITKLEEAMMWANAAIARGTAS